MYSVDEIIIVEGKYDKHAVSAAVNATIIETKGFGIFSDKEKAALIKRMAEKRGVIILTDSDSGGFLIRNHLKGILKDCNIKNAYIPDIRGKEKRKPGFSREGKLGVEGMTTEIILEAIRLSGARLKEDEKPHKQSGGITKTDMYRTGLSGREDSREKRAQLIKSLCLPERLSANALLDILNVLYTREEFFSLVSPQDPPCIQTL